ncbi:MAG: hypothetical protein EBZ91_13285, partial [Gammaproteobacteria bacterium]|nr:hypothetical protein [Gammaproteobacteria bacterium]
MIHGIRIRSAWVALLALLAGALLVVDGARTSEESKPVARTYRDAPPAPARQTAADADAKSAGCLDCHSATDQPTMHANPGVVLGCTDCHGGDAAVRWSDGSSAGGLGVGARSSPSYMAARDSAHVLPRYPDAWKFPSSANPERTYALLNKESP